MCNCDDKKDEMTSTGDVAGYTIPLKKGDEDDIEDTVVRKKSFMELVIEDVLEHYNQENKKHGC